MVTENDNHALREFLLGTGSAETDERIGVRIISDADFEPEVLFAEESLVEEFLDGRLSAADREAFLSNFLVTPERLELLDEIAGLRKLARSSPPATEAEANVEVASPGFLVQLSRLFRAGWIPVAAVVLLLLIAGGVWRFGFSSPGLNERERLYAARNDGDLSEKSLTAGMKEQNLKFGTLRGDSLVRIKSAELTDDVFFRLGLPTGTPIETKYDLKLTRNGAVVFRQLALRQYLNPYGSEVKVIIPKAVLSSGAYELQLGEDIRYAFVVE